MAIEMDISYVTIDGAIRSLQEAREQLIEGGCSEDNLNLEITQESEPYSDYEYIHVEAYGYRKV